jgi:hypothetical protein
MGGSVEEMAEQPHEPSRSIKQSPSNARPPIGLEMKTDFKRPVRAISREHGSVSRPPRAAAEGGTHWSLPSPHAMVGLVCFLLIGWGYANADALTLAADDGLGYALGPIGLACMTLLLLYSVRKRVRPMRNAGPLSIWLEIHLILGLLGPTAILYHARFESGSTNATVAMACMLAVAGSGVGGRFVYGRLHRGLAGPRRTVDSLRRNARQELTPIESVIERVPQVKARLARFEAVAFGPLPWVLGLTRPFWLRPWSWIARIGTVSALVHEADARFRRGAIRRAIRHHFSSQCRAVELSVYEQIFSLWHAIHVPLCFILFISAVVHVVAVHLY